MNGYLAASVLVDKDPYAVAVALVLTHEPPAMRPGSASPTSHGLLLYGARRYPTPAAAAHIER